MENVRVRFRDIKCNMGKREKLLLSFSVYSFFFFSWHSFWIIKRKRKSHPVRVFFFFFNNTSFCDVFSFKKFRSFSTNYGCKKRKKRRNQYVGTKIGISTKGNFIRRTKIIQRRQSDFNIPFRKHAPLQLRPLRIKYQPPSPNKMPTTFSNFTDATSNIARITSTSNWHFLLLLLFFFKRTSNENKV